MSIGKRPFSVLQANVADDRIAAFSCHSGLIDVGHVSGQDRTWAA